MAKSKKQKSVEIELTKSSKPDIVSEADIIKAKVTNVTEDSIEVKPLDLPVLGEQVEQEVNETLPSLPRNVRRAYHKMLGLPQFKRQFEAYAKKKFK